MRVLMISCPPHTHSRVVGSAPSDCDVIMSLADPRSGTDPEDSDWTSEDVTSGDFWPQVSSVSSVEASWHGAV